MKTRLRGRVSIERRFTRHELVQLGLSPSDADAANDALVGLHVVVHGFYELDGLSGTSLADFETDEHEGRFRFRVLRRLAQSQTTPNMKDQRSVPRKRQHR